MINSIILTAKIVIATNYNSSKKNSDELIRCQKREKSRVEPRLESPR